MIGSGLDSTGFRFPIGSHIQLVKDARCRNKMESFYVFDDGKFKQILSGSDIGRLESAVIQQTIHPCRTVINLVYFIKQKAQFSEIKAEAAFGEVSYHYFYFVFVFLFFQIYRSEEHT